MVMLLRSAITFSLENNHIKLPRAEPCWSSFVADILHQMAIDISLFVYILTWFLKTDSFSS